MRVEKKFPRLDFVIDDAIQILCKGILPSSIDNLFWYELNQKNYAPDHSHSMAKLLTTLLNSLSDLGHGEVYIERMVNALQGLEEKEQKQLQVTLLQHWIHCFENAAMA